MSTIVSRCIRLDFELLNPDQSEKRLREVTELEGLVVDDVVLEKLVHRGAGGMRDTLISLLRTSSAFLWRSCESERILLYVGLSGYRGN